MARYVCGNEERRDALRKAIKDGKDLNGIDFLEVVDRGEETEQRFKDLRQRLLGVRLFGPVPATLSAANVRIEGGVRVRVGVEWALSYPAVEADPNKQDEEDFLIAYFPAALRDGNLLVIRTDSTGDYSTYRLRLVKSSTEPEPPDKFDPRLSEVDFSFKVECPTDFDCKPEVRCTPEPPAEPELSYLAKDYASFRRLMLDRLSAIAPTWRERNPADVGIALVELMAYVGDQLSYFQDAAATEAYLGTARKRTSVRRHVRLVDYFLHEGANARTWIHFQVNAGSPADGRTLPGPGPDSPGTRVLTRWTPDGALVPEAELPKALAGGAAIFETLAEVTLREPHNAIAFYTWSDRECCLPKGATAATLVRPAVKLEIGQLLLFEEILGPETGSPADADPRHRHVVRLTKAKPVTDPVTVTDLVEIEWDAADALPFPLCISAVTDAEHGERAIDNVSVARGNVAPADHGYTVSGEDLGKVPADRPFRPVLEHGPLTQAAPLPQGFGTRPAVLLAGYQASEAEPSVELKSGGVVWSPRRDLLASDKFARHFVAEVGEDGRAGLRFGDDENGRAPAVDAGFTATYRVGNGKAGNVGADVLCQLVFDPLLAEGITKVRNPLPGAGGIEPESLEEARQYAPQAFRIQQRAVTEADYAEMAQRHPEVQRAAATFRWTGSWYTVFLTVDRVGGRKVDALFEAELRRHMERFRMAGYDLEVDAPRFVALDLALDVCARPDYFRSQVKAALLDRFSSRLLADGRKGFFHPDEWTFGQPVYLSSLYAAASEVEGVESVVVKDFRRLGSGSDSKQEKENGVLPIGRLEIVVLDNDPSLQENGHLTVSVGGGK